MSLLSLPDLDQETHPYCSSNFQVKSIGYPETLVIEMEDDPVPTTSIIQHRQLSTYDGGQGWWWKNYFANRFPFFPSQKLPIFVCLSISLIRHSITRTGLNTWLNQ